MEPRSRRDNSTYTPEIDPEVKELLERTPQTIIHDQIAFPVPNLSEHNWRQHGISVDCTSCPTPHGFTVGPDKQLTGIDERGYPTFKSISTSPAPLPAS